MKRGVVFNDDCFVVVEKDEHDEEEEKEEEEGLESILDTSLLVRDLALTNDDAGLNEDWLEEEVVGWGGEDFSFLAGCST